MNARVIRTVGLAAAVIAAASITLAAPARAGHAYGHQRGDWDRDTQPSCEAPTVVYGPAPCPPPVYVSPGGFSVSFSSAGRGLAVNAGYVSPLPPGWAYQDPMSGVTYVTYADWTRHFGYRHAYRVVRIDTHRHGEWRGHGRWGRD
ncbi:MAG: hypothetical protein ACHQ52_13905 [Candidatus Eisenbacteria bacterium]